MFLVSLQVAAQPGLGKLAVPFSYQATTKENLMKAIRIKLTFISSVCAMFACLGLGVGGNLPVDGALFLEFLPFASGNLLTMLSIWWPLGTLIGRYIPCPPSLFLFSLLSPRPLGFLCS